MRRKGLGGRKCKFESLENRRVMAGFVSAQLSHHDLVIKGDGQDNAITITAGANLGEFVVTGVADNNGFATNVGGLNNGAVTIRGVTGGVSIDMGGGNDNVTMTGTTLNPVLFRGKSSLKGGSGVDNFHINSVTFGDSLKIDTGAGADIVLMENTSVVAGKAVVDTGSGHDSVTITGTDTTAGSALSSRFGALEVSLGNGDDELSIEHTNVITKTVLDGGKGINFFPNFQNRVGNSFGVLTKLRI